MGPYKLVYARLNRFVRVNFWEFTARKSAPKNFSNTNPRPGHEVCNACGVSPRAWPMHIARLGVEKDEIVMVHGANSDRPITVFAALNGFKR